MIPELPTTRRFDALSVGDAVEPWRVDIDTFDGDVARHEPMQLPTDRMVGLRFLKCELRRRRKWWLAFGALGLVVGAMYHVVVPMKYAATATVYLVNPSSSASTVAAQNDLAMLDNNAVAEKALAKLHEPGLTSSSLLGKLPGTLVGDDVMDITVYGSSPQVAVRRVNALTSAYLSFRADQFRAQNRAVVAATDDQVANLQSEVAKLSAQIPATATSHSDDVTSLETERAAALNELTGLQNSIEEDDLGELAVTQGSKVIAPGSIVPTSKKRVILFDGLTGLAAGLGGSVLVLAALAMVSDRVRRREDVAEILGAPIALSVGRIGPRLPWRRTTLNAMTASPDRALSSLVGFLRGELRTADSYGTQLVVALDDPAPPAIALIVLANELSEQGARVVLVDASDRRGLARALGRESVGLHAIESGHGLPTLTLLVAPLPWDDAFSQAGNADVAVLASANVTLVLGSVDPGVGAWHLTRWSGEAIVTVSAGRSSAQRIGAASELLESAGITVESAVLLDADSSDESVGIPLRDAEPARRAFGATRVSEPT